MAKKAILTIDVNDEKFRKFHDLFQKYQDELDKQPGKWDAFNNAMTAGIGAIASDTHGIAKYLKEATHAQQQFHTATRKSGGALKGMLKDTQSISKKLFGISRFMLKTAGWGLGLGAAGIFGMDRIASDAIQTQRTARGLGLNTGQLRAWNIQYKRTLGPNVLETIASQQATVGGAGILANLAGIPDAGIGKIPATRLAYLIGTRLRKEAKGWKSSQYGTMLEAHLYKQYTGIDTSDLRRLMIMRDSTWQQAHVRYESDKNKDRTGRAAVHHLFTFQQALQQTGKMLGTDLQSRLSALGPSLGGFVKALGTDAATLLNGVLSKQNLAEVQKGIQSFTHFLVSGEAKADLEKFASTMGRLSNDMIGLGRWVRNVYDGTKSTYQFMMGQSGGSNNVPTWAKWAQRTLQNGDNLITAPFVDAYDSGKRFLGMMGYVSPSAYRYADTANQKRRLREGWQRMASYKATIDAAGNLYKVSPDTIRAIGSVESAGNPNAESTYRYKGPYGHWHIGHARGLMQITSGTARQFGLNPNDLFDPIPSIYEGTKIYAAYRAQLRKAYPKDNASEIRAMAVAAYHGGVGTIKNAVRQFGPQWFKHTGQQTEYYVPLVMNAAKNSLHDRARMPALNIHVSNTTASHVAVSSNAAAH